LPISGGGGISKGDVQNPIVAVSPKSIPRVIESTGTKAN
jgi:hypothetical protein